MSHGDLVAPTHPYTRYVALGDSQTEGLNDGDEVHGYRGWADRLADQLAAGNPGLEYANLAVRGRLAGQIHAEQLQPALSLRPDLVTVVGGMNDLIRPRYNAEEVIGYLERIYAAFSTAGAHVVTLTFPDIGKLAPLARPLTRRVLDFNARLRAVAHSHGVTVVDTFDHAICTDPRIWSPDRLHANSAGHARIAAAVARALSLPGSDDTWTHALPPEAASTAWRTAAAELRWVTGFLGPWLVRRVRGRSSGDGRVAKRPELRPVRGEGDAP